MESVGEVTEPGGWGGMQANWRLGIESLEETPGEIRAGCFCVDGRRIIRKGVGVENVSKLEEET